MRRDAKSELDIRIEKTVEAYIEEKYSGKHLDLIVKEVTDKVDRKVRTSIKWTAMGKIEEIVENIAKPYVLEAIDKALPHVEEIVKVQSEKLGVRLPKTIAGKLIGKLMNSLKEEKNET